MKKKLLLFLPLALISLSSCGNVPLDQESFYSKLIPNWVSFLTQFLALIVLLIVVTIFAYKPVKKIIKKRQDFIENNIKESEENKKTALENKTKSEEMIIESNKKANEIISDANKAAMVEREKVINETNEIIKKMKLDAEKDIEKAKVDAEEEIRKEMISIALSTSEEILKREVNSKDNEKLAEDFIKGVKK